MVSDEKAVISSERIRIDAPQKKRKEIQFDPQDWSLIELVSKYKGISTADYIRQCAVVDAKKHRGLFI